MAHQSVAEQARESGAVEWPIFGLIGGPAVPVAEAMTAHFIVLLHWGPYVIDRKN